MAGADNIVNEILLEAHSRADYIKTVAEEKAESILKKAEDESREALENAARESDKAAKEYAARVASSGEMNRKKAMLAGRQEMIDEVIRQAYEKLAGQDSASYFDMILKLLKNTAHAGDGVMCLSEKDLSRLPADFREKAEEAGRAAGGTVRVSDTPENIENGFILKYGGIEENCTLRALFDDREEQLRDIVQSVLW
ncbi:MAG: V-type ATP synthase subunit E [Lachnospiraceae bacterium]|jgi:V/A-type H+-transporting ATPase subunit E